MFVLVVLCRRGEQQINRENTIFLVIFTSMGVGNAIRSTVDIGYHPGSSVHVI